VEQHLDEIRDCIGDTPSAAALFLCRGGFMRVSLPQFTVIAVTVDRVWALVRDDRKTAGRYQMVGSWPWVDVHVGRAFRGLKLFLADASASVITPAGDDGQWVIDLLNEHADGR
jgi:hypothetical protein